MHGVRQGGGQTVIHEVGWKGERDRAQAIQSYERMSKFFHEREVRPRDMAEMTNLEVYRLAEDLFNRQSRKAKDAYAEEIGAIPRREPLAFKWFLHDLRRYKGATSGMKRLLMTLQSPFRYPGFLRRAKADQEKAKAEAKRPVNAVPFEKKAAE
jgi:hypothetical protein